MQMFLIFVNLMIAFLIPSSAENSNTSLELGGEREGRIFRIKIPATVCGSSFEGKQEGYCDGILSCAVNGGIITGICPKTVGFCCVATVGCGKTIANKISYFTNKPSFWPWADSKECSVTILRYRPNVAQIRLDFLDFELIQPNSEGICNVEKLVITGGSAPAPPVVCGSNTGQHMYVSFQAAATASIVLNMTLAEDTTSHFKIKITQILSTDTAALAPAGCLQVFSELTGVVTSFNFLEGIVLSPTQSTRQLANQNYVVCVRPNGKTSITWKKDIFSSSGYFTMTDKVDSTTIPLINGNVVPNVAKFDASCTSDFVTIISTGTNRKFCGLIFPPEVTSITKAPSGVFNLTVTTNGAEAPNDSGNLGFALAYALK